MFFVVDVVDVVSTCVPPVRPRRTVIHSEDNKSKTTTKFDIAKKERRPDKIDRLEDTSHSQTTQKKNKIKYLDRGRGSEEPTQRGENW